MIQILVALMVTWIVSYAAQRIFDTVTHLFKPEVRCEPGRDPPKATIYRQLKTK